MADFTRLICAAGALAEGGKGIRFKLHPADEGEKGFAIRYDGQARAFINRCPHLGTELDWQPGEFFEEAGLYLVCSTHGALFEPASGRCIAGPCQGDILDSIPVQEKDGQVFIPQDTP